jgi:CheY-like chemotaxis protein
MPENVSVALIEDSQSWIDIFKECIERGGHSIVATASSFKEAMELIAEIQRGLKSMSFY